MSIAHIAPACGNGLCWGHCTVCQQRRQAGAAESLEAYRRIQQQLPKPEPTPASKLLAEKEAELRELEIMLKVKEVEKKIASIKAQIEEVK